MPLLFPIGHVYRISSSILSIGDQASAILNDVNHGQDSGQMLIMKMYYQPKGDIGSLNISLTRHRRAPILVYSSSKSSIHSGWQEIQLCLPPGNFSLILTATQGDIMSSDVAVDEMHLTGQVCHDFINSVGKHFLLEE